MSDRLRLEDAVSTLAQGAALLNGGHYQDAAVLLTAAQQRHPYEVRILTLNAQAMLALGRNDMAIGVLFLAADLQPDNAKIHFALGILLHKQGKSELAVSHSLQAFQLVPNHLHATALSCVLITLGRYDEALVASAHALSLKPDHWEAQVNRAISFQGLGRFEEAIAAGHEAVAADPNNAGARYNLASNLLGLGRMTAEAWELFDWRLRLDGNPSWLLTTAAQRWRGEDIADCTILLQAEQGFGDTLQFVRYAPLVAKRAGRVLLVVQPALTRLLRHVPGVDHVLSIGDELPPTDVVCPLLSLPGIFGTTLETIPTALPYDSLFTPSHRTADGVLRVGLVWAGSQTFVDDRQRSLLALELNSLSGIPDVQFYNLQRHESGRDNLPSELGAVDLMSGVTDFYDTAERIAGLDLIVSVDTGVAHLAATMGKPVWLLSRWRGCWRWLHDRVDSPWYPSVRIFRQTQPNNWGEVVDQVRQRLSTFGQK